MTMPQTQQPTKDNSYLHTIRAGALLPFTQATILALVVTVVTWIIAANLGALDPHRWAMTTGALSWLWMLYKLMRHWLVLTTPIIETIIRQDINGDGKIGKSEPAPAQDEADDEPREVITIRLIKNDGHVSDTIDLPGNRDALALLARGLLGGVPFSESMWTGKGKPFTSRTFRELRSVMIARELAEYINADAPKQGIQLTDAGRAVMQRLAVPHSPTTESE